MVLAHAGTTESARFILVVCAKDNTLVANCSAMVTKLSITAVPTPEIIDKIIVSYIFKYTTLYNCL